MNHRFTLFQQRYVLRLMVWTFLLGFAWATITWLARVTHGQTNYVSVTNPVVFELYIPSPFLRYEVTGSNISIYSHFEPITVKTNGRWRITFKP